MISCLCPTYNRPELLAEAIESFLRQDTCFESELIVLNDCVEQTLLCSSPGVKIVNLKSRLPTLGDKYNAMIEIADGEILLPWEDDDISLPRRIAQAAAALEHSDYFNPQASWYLDREKLYATHKHGVCHNASAFRREAWRAVGGYPRCSVDQDARMDQFLKLSTARKARPLDPKWPPEWTYIYRWNVTTHLSAWPGVWEQVAQDAKQVGLITIQPRWSQDFEALTRGRTE